jgi:two-component system nitrate/nitrite response regulator NarL
VIERSQSQSARLDLTTTVSTRDRETKRVRVLVADDHPKVRWALRTFMQEEPELTVVGEASDADMLLSQALLLRPDVILLEWELVGMPASKLLLALRALDLVVQVIVLSWQPDSRQAALVAGADDFVSKANGPEPLLVALRQVIKAR